MKYKKIFLNKCGISELNNLSEGRFVQLVGVQREAKAFYINLLSVQTEKSIVVVLSDEKEMLLMQKALFFYKNLIQPEKEIKILTFPEYDRDLFLPLKLHENIIMERIRTLWHLTNKESFILLLPAKAAVRKLLLPEVYKSACYSISAGDEIPYDLFIKIVDDNGYKLKEMVTTFGEYSIRGGIIDLFSPACSNPIRVQFFGDTIEAVRLFDVKTQTSLEKIEQCIVLPCKEFLITDNIKNIFKARLETSSITLAEAQQQLIEQFITEGYFPSYEDYLPLFFNETASIFDYCSQEAITLIDEPDYVNDQVKNMFDEYAGNEEKYRNRQMVNFDLKNIFLQFEDFIQKIHQAKITINAYLENKSEQGNSEIVTIKSKSSSQFEGEIPEFIKEIKHNYKNRINSFLVFHKLEKAQKLINLLKEEGIGVVNFSEIHFDDELFEGRIIVVEGDLPYGFIASDAGMAFYVEENIFGEYRLIDRKYEVPMEVFQGDCGDLSVGDFVVHLNHGIGKFKGLHYLMIDGKESEIMTVEYAGGDLLHVPVESMNLVQKYTSSGESFPMLDKLGGRTWIQKKQKAQRAIEKMAKELVELYAYRKMITGIRFLPDDAFQHEFESLFEYEETPDQLFAIKEIKKDMESEKLMDRLICGDVGYGKTEVAMRAAFKAVFSGKQVAIVAPTTVLAFQHFQTFKKRFEQFPVHIAMLSRLTYGGQIKKVIADITAGKVDIIIGTHRLFSKDINFSHLGLLIVDEEQRFGVLHKEKIKELHKNIDVLMLTATPIPRTLEMAFLGIRDMSLITTPPQDRLAIQTHIIKFNEEVIASAINKEILREGQVFFIHNEIEKIYWMEKYVKKICPEARIACAHGKMNPKQLENIMFDFINYKYDVLLSTTIIENGIDIPRANTIIINNAEKFGLSQLYQLRGRVGRSSRRAYAYFIISNESSLSEIAKKRLAALKEFTELGSGFRLAAMDLQIRGAGNLLGKQQHGHIVELGFETYCHLLEETAQKILNVPLPSRVDSEIKLDLDVQIPQSYIPSPNLRMLFYKKIGGAQSSTELDCIKNELIDRFGSIPLPVNNLFYIKQLKTFAKEKQIKSIIQRNERVFINWQISDDLMNQPQFLSDVLKAVSNSSAQFVNHASLVLPLHNYEMLLEFIKKLPDLREQPQQNRESR